MIYLGNGMYSDAGGYLQHHGIKGQKWGVRNGPPYPIDDSPEIHRAKDSLQRNISKWGMNKDNNILYIAGRSGSGKSTKALEMAKRNNADIIHLDLYFDPKGGYDAHRSKSFDTYLKKHFPDYVKLGWPKNKISLKEWGKLLDPFEKTMDSYGKYMYKKGIPVIAEGVQLMDDTLYPDKTYFKNKPTILMTTGSIKSNVRAAKRDNITVIRDLINQWEWSKMSTKEYKAFKNEIAHSKY